MTVDPNPLSVTIHLRELDRQALEMHRSRQGVEEAKPPRVQSAPRFVDDWIAKVAAFFLALRPTH